MGVLIQGPWGKKPKEEETSPAASSGSADDASNQYPWYALCAPKGTKPDEYARTLASLKKLASLAGPSGKLLLPRDWSWNFQPMIDQLNRIAASADAEEEEEIPDDIA